MEDCYGCRLRHKKKGNDFSKMVECQVTVSAIAVSKPHIQFNFKRMVVHYSILPRETNEQVATRFFFGFLYF